jgi:hypothetical protein
MTQLYSFSLDILNILSDTVKWCTVSPWFSKQISFFISFWLLLRNQYESFETKQWRRRFLFRVQGVVLTWLNETSGLSHHLISPMMLFEVLSLFYLLFLEQKESEKVWHKRRWRRIKEQTAPQFKRQQDQKNRIFILLRSKQILFKSILQSLIFL